VILVGQLGVIQEFIRTCWIVW